MPGTVKVRILAARNLPVMDRATFLTDAFVEIRLGNTTFKTEVVRRSLNPTWNSEWFKYELDDQELQEEALQVRVLDHDTYSAHDAIGRVYIDLNPLLVKDQNRSINGWFPIYDTMHGIRGEINLLVRVDIFSDACKFRQSSVGVRFFYSTSIPHGYKLHSVLGFVEELLINADPEYQLIEKIRTSRASNEARQRLFSKLNGQLQRKLGLKVLEMGGNSVIGYQLHFDLEGETGIVVRGIGTSASLYRTGPNATTPPPSPHLSRDPFQSDNSEPDSPVSSSPVEETAKGFEPTGFKFMKRSISFGVSLREKAFPKLYRYPVAPLANAKSVDYAEFPFMTISQPPVGFIQHYGSVVSAKSVKLLDKISHADESEVRDSWWTELRTEIRSHMKTMGCTSVLAYREESAIFEEVIVLSAYGTAVKLNPYFEHQLPGAAASANGLGPVTPLVPGGLGSSPLPNNSLAFSLDRPAFERERSRNTQQQLHVDVGLAPLNPTSSAGVSPGPETLLQNSDWGPSSQQTLRPQSAPNSTAYTCALCHVTYTESLVPFAVSLARCAVCQRGCVPDMIFSTTDIPEELACVGRPALVQARVCRPKRESKGEACAKEISDCLPFIEYDLHRKLMQKLKLRGMNALFGLKIRIAIGENAILALGTATGLYAAALPPPQLPKVSKKGGRLADSDLDKMEQQLKEHLERNRDHYQLPNNPITSLPCTTPNPNPRPDTLTTNQLPSQDDCDDSYCGPAYFSSTQPPITISTSPVAGGVAPSSSHTSADASETDLPSLLPRDAVAVETEEDLEMEDLATLFAEPLPPADLIVSTTEKIPLIADCASGFGGPQMSATSSNSHLTQSNGASAASLGAGACPNVLPASATAMASSTSLLPSETMQNFVRLCRVSLTGDLSDSKPFLRILKDFNRSTWFKFRKLMPCQLTALDYRLSITEDNDVLILATGMCTGMTFQQVTGGDGLGPLPPTTLGPQLEPEKAVPSQDLDMSGDGSSIDQVKSSLQSLRLSRQASRTATSNSGQNGGSFTGSSGPPRCLLTPLSLPMRAQVDCYLGNLDFFFVRETTTLRDYGGVSGFLHSCLSEVQSVVSAHTVSVGGNALLSFHLSEIQLVDSEGGRNQAQCLLNVCGDMARISFPPPLLPDTLPTPAPVVGAPLLCHQVIAES